MLFSSRKRKFSEDFSRNQKIRSLDNSNSSTKSDNKDFTIEKLGKFEPFSQSKETLKRTFDKINESLDKIFDILKNKNLERSLKKNILRKKIVLIQSKKNLKNYNLIEFPCFSEEEIGLNCHLSKLYINTELDDDVDTDDELLEHYLKKGVREISKAITEINSYF